MAQIAVASGTRVVGVTEVVVQGGFSLDTAIIEALPEGDTVVSAELCGESAWSSTARIGVKKRDGSRCDYLLKTVKGDRAASHVLGEHHSMLELWKTMPDLVPRPRAHGQCHGIDASFFLCDYLELDHRPPDAAQLGAKMAQLHQTSRSPAGEFGFYVTPYHGKLPLTVDWDPSWTSFFGKLLNGVYQCDIRENGHWKEFDDAMKLVLTKVVPRLLEPLESDGKSVKPCLIHGDLRTENIGTELGTGEIYVFDSCAYYAHHEMAMGMWRVDHRHMMAEEYRSEYFSRFKPDDPVEEFDDRNRLYAIKERVMYSAHVPGTRERERALEDMRYLIENYADNRNGCAGTVAHPRRER